MRAASYDVFGGPEDLQIGERPTPWPGAEHVLLRMHAAGGCIWDVGIMRCGFGQVSLPRIPGSEVAGLVEASAGEFNVGDRVFCSLWESGGAGVSRTPAEAVPRLPQHESTALPQFPKASREAMEHVAAEHTRGRVVLQIEP